MGVPPAGPPAAHRGPGSREHIQPQGHGWLWAYQRDRHRGRGHRSRGPPTGVQNVPPSVPRVVVWQTRSLHDSFPVFLLSQGVLKGAQRDSWGGQSRCCSVPARVPALLRAPGSPDLFPKGPSFSLVDFALCFLTHRVLLAPNPISPCTVVPVVVSLWLLIGHSSSVGRFHEGKGALSGASGWRARPQWPPGLGCGLGPAALKLGERAGFFFFFF